jgi:hypothetical protein
VHGILLCHPNSIRATNLIVFTANSKKLKGHLSSLLKCPM